MNVGIVFARRSAAAASSPAELAKSLADRGREVHLLSADPPFRLGEFQPGLCFHRVITPAYPLFREPQYLISLATRIVQVTRGSTWISCTLTTPCRMPPRRTWPSRS